MVFSVITIILSIIAYKVHWVAWIVIATLVLAVVEYIIEASTADIFEIEAITIAAIILGIVALIMGAIAIAIRVHTLKDVSTVLLEIQYLSVLNKLF